MAIVSGTVPECGSDCFFRTQDTERILPFTESGSDCFLQSQDMERILPFTELGLMTKHNLGIPISCFDFGSSHVDPREYKLVS
jgi:hypothetical protein